MTEKRKPFAYGPDPAILRGGGPFNDLTAHFLFIITFKSLQLPILRTKTFIIF
ncbi:MAG: hypothetical protein QXG81_00475 [Ignisphaera sp.]